MTKRDLSQLWYLNREIGQEQERREQLRAAATGTGAQLSGLPGGGALSDKTAIAAQIADIDAMIAAKVQRYAAEYIRLSRYIATVEDSLTRQILTLRYVDGLSWTAVAAHIGGGNTADSVRMAHNRFLHG
ncbi:MAG: hypothetical protein RSD27_11030 [Ruthenibacterium sp.]